MNIRHENWLVVLTLLAGPVFSGTPGQSEIDAVFAGYDSTVSPGCSMAVFRNGDIAYTRGYGMANLEYGIANAPDTVFRIGSTSKQFTAMTMALLAEQGKLSLDDDIHKFFPTMPDYGEPVTVRQLIHHTSGTRDYLTLTDLADWGEYYTVEEALQIINRQQDLNFSPGTDHLYSNTGYFLMSQIVEIVTGQSIRDWAAENMFKPLGMDNTHFHDDHNHIVHKRADGYADAETGGFEISMTVLDMVGDGGVYTTVEDMLKWDRNFYNNQLGKGDPALIQLLETPGRLKNGEALTYAFGLSVDEFAGTREVSHGGAFVGYRAGFNRYPDHKLSVVVFCNYAHTNPTGLAREVASLYLANGQMDSKVPTTESNTEIAGVAEVSSRSLERVTGEYLDAKTFMVRSIVTDEGKLFYDRGGDNRTELEPMGNDHFVMADVPVLVQVSFDVGDGVMSVAVEGQAPLSLRKFNRTLPTTDDLEAYPGAFYSQELNYTQVLKTDGKVIMAERRNGPLSFQPLLPDVFISDDGLSIKFERNVAGNVSGFEMQAGRVRNIGFVRLKK